METGQEARASRATQPQHIIQVDVLRQIRPEITCPEDGVRQSRTDCNYRHVPEVQPVGQIRKMKVRRLLLGTSHNMDIWVVLVRAIWASALVVDVK